MRVEIQSKTGKKIISINRRKAIREKCLNCAAWFYPGVTNCEFTACPLYPFRMGTGRQAAKARSKAILQYCLFCMGGQQREISKCTCPDCSLYAYRNSRIDRSINIDFLPKNGHIQARRGDENEKAYPDKGTDFFN